MKKLLALLLALMLCASVALAEEGVFDYTVFEDEANIIDFDQTSDEWVASVALFSVFTDAVMTIGVTGTSDGSITAVAFVILGTWEEVKVQVDDTVYTFNTALQQLMFGDAVIGLLLTPKMEPFFRALATAEEVNVWLTQDGEEVDTSITGSSLANLQFLLAELFAQDVMNCYTQDGESAWNTFGIFQTMTVD